MIKGRFEAGTGRPYVEAAILIPRLLVSGNVSFLIDTGADVTTLHPVDVARLGMAYSDLDPPTSSSIGVGGRARASVEPALLSFLDGRRLATFRAILSIPASTQHNQKVTSLLGRDVLNRLRITYDGPAEKALMRVIDADGFHAGLTTDRRTVWNP